MLDALSAEALKLSRHRATWFLVWIFPIGLTVLLPLGMAIDMAQPSEQGQTQAASAWLEETVFIWRVPTTGFGRYLIAAYLAVAIAGEYSWNTWKLVIPHRARSTLLAAKLAIVSAFLYLAYLITAVMTVLLMWLWDVATGDPIPAGITAANLFQAHALAVLNSLPPFLYTLAFASLAAILTRSMIATLVIALFVTSESMFVVVAPFLYGRAPGLVSALVHVLPGYHLHNLESWITEGSARVSLLSEARSVALAWPVSAAALGAWIVGLASLAFASFRRQDIN
jgi:hypothetical protein